MQSKAFFGLWSWQWEFLVRVLAQLLSYFSVYCPIKNETQVSCFRDTTENTPILLFLLKWSQKLLIFITGVNYRIKTYLIISELANSQLKKMKHFASKMRQNIAIEREIKGNLSHYLQLELPRDLNPGFLWNSMR